MTTLEDLMATGEPDTPEPAYPRRALAAMAVAAMAITVAAIAALATSDLANLSARRHRSDAIASASQRPPVSVAFVTTVALDC